MRTFVLRDDQCAAHLWAYLKVEWRKGAAINRPLSVTIQAYSDKRTDPQNRALHALLGHIADAVWVGDPPRQVDAKAWKVYFKEMFLPAREQFMPDGEIRQVPISTTELTVQEFSVFIDQVAAHAATEFNFDPRSQPA